MIILKEIHDYYNKFFIFFINRCSHPSIDNDSFYANNSYLSINNISLQQCSYIENNIEYRNCSKWVFDKTYYELTLTEEVNI